MGTTTGEFIQELTRNHDVIVIGGLAIIAHGFNRPTMDADVWLDPMESPMSWAETVQAVCDRFPNLTIHTLPGWRKVEGLDVANAAEEVGMVRILGLDCPLDVFRRPNEFPEDSFAEVLSRCSRNNDGTWLPDAIDLAITKDLTNREKMTTTSAFWNPRFEPFGWRSCHMRPKRKPAHFSSATWIGKPVRQRSEIPTCW